MSVSLTCHIFSPQEVVGGKTCVLLCKNVSECAVHNLLCGKTN